MRRIIVVGAIALLTGGCGATRTVTTTATATSTQTVTRTRTVSHRVVRTVAATPTGAAAASSGSQGGTTSSSAPPGSSGSGASTLQVQDFNGNTLDVTADGIIDPAQPANPMFDSAPAGSRLVALVLTLKSAGPGTVSDDANNDATVIGSDGQNYTATFDGITGCTNFNHGAYTIVSGDSQHGCVVFQIPNGVNVKSVQFALGGNTVQFNK